jgi:4-amino-4-deoxy-L-arabinose transferase-like glycosyltransferase
LLLVLGTGAFFRFYLLNTLPPGLYDTSARLGLQALDLSEHGWLPGLNAVNDFAPLFTWLQAISINLFGHTELALRLWPALLGSLAVLTTWLWARSWFGARIGWLAAFLIAVTPWAVTLSRDDIPTAIFPLLVTTTLWLATRAWRTPPSSASTCSAARLAGCSPPRSLLSAPFSSPAPSSSWVWAAAVCLASGAWPLVWLC